MTLAEWNDRLANHFEAVHAGRPSGRPIFALEHGLTPEDVSNLSEAVRERLRTAPPTTQHRLPLVVYAAELGYRFDGTEFWPSFEAETPGWTQHGRRAWLRRAFQLFHRDYGGARPSGPWAEHFSIIAWPITHAVLPADLQRHLVRALWGIRSLLLVLDSDDPGVIGRHVRSASAGASSRFLALCEQPALVGQIALALFEEDASQAFLEPDLVARLVAGVRRRAEDSSLFDEARHAARLGLRGIRSRGTGERPAVQTEDSQDLDMPSVPSPRSLGLQVDLELRPRLGRDGAERWDAVLKLPALRPLVAYRPDLHDALDTSWLDVAGSDRSLAPGVLLHGRQTVVLDHLPGPDQPLLQLDTQERRLQHLVSALRLPRSEHRVFRVASDGAAREVRGRVLRPGQRYVLLTRGELPEALADARVPLTCSGAEAAQFEVADPDDGRWRDALAPYGIDVRSTVSIWPAGIPPTAWDGAGSVEWLAADPIAVGLSADAPVELVELTLDGEGEISVIPPPGQPVYVSLGTLRPGTHILHATALLADGTLAEGELLLRVRLPTPWTSAGSPANPLRVRVTPAASIRDLLTGHAIVEAYGPPDVKARLRFAFLDRQGATIGPALQTGRSDLPLTADQWGDALDRYVLSDERALARAVRASTVCLTIDSGAAGSAEVRFDRTDEPLRWDRRRDTVQLLDDRDDETPVSVQALWANEPLRAVPVPTSEALEGLAAGVGGVLIATAGHRAAAVLSPPALDGSLADIAALRPPCNFGDPLRTPATLDGLLACLEQWAMADRVGIGGAGRILRRHVLREGARAVAATCGPNWVRAENAASQSGRSGIDEFASHIPARSSPPTWRRDLPTAPALARADLRTRVSRLATLGQALGALPPRQAVAQRRRDRGPDHPRWLAEFVLRLASAPHTVRAWAGDYTHDGLGHVLDHPHLLRAARYIVIASASGTDDSDEDLTLYPSWSWPSLS